MTDHRKTSEIHEDEVHSIHNTNAVKQIHASLAGYHATLALLDATLAHTAAMERIARSSTPVLGGRL